MESSPSRNPMSKFITGESKFEPNLMCLMNIILILVGKKMELCECSRAAEFPEELCECSRHFGSEPAVDRREQSEPIAI
ncbi:unnamed protein product [Brassica oleracea var. botrytis]